MKSISSIFYETNKRKIVTVFCFYEINLWTRIFLKIFRLSKIISFEKSSISSYNKRESCSFLFLFEEDFVMIFN